MRVARCDSVLTRPLGAQFVTALNACNQLFKTPLTQQHVDMIVAAAPVSRGKINYESLLESLKVSEGAEGPPGAAAKPSISDLESLERTVKGQR